MEKEFVKYEHALALKELGFDEPTIFSFANKELMVRLGDFEASWCMMGEVEVMDYNNIPSLPNHISAPTYQQAFRWFREKQNIDNCISYSRIEDNSWYYQYYKSGLVGGFKTYEEAEQACLDKLIEIAKNK
jgi:hypothetical protein